MGSTTVDARRLTPPRTSFDATEDARARLADSVTSRTDAYLVVAEPGAGSTAWLGDVAGIARGAVWLLDGSATRAGTRTAAGDLVAQLDGSLELLHADERDALRRYGSVAGSARLASLRDATRALVELANSTGSPYRTMWLIDRYDLIDDATCDLLMNVLDSDEAPVIVATTQQADESWPGMIVELPGIAADRLASVLVERHETSARNAQRLALFADGNPTVARSFGVRLSRAQRDGTDSLPRPLPLDERLLASVSVRLAGLDSDTRHGLLLGAATTMVGEFGQPIDTALMTTNDVELARSSGWVTETNDFHPRWMADAMLAVVDPVARRAVHAELATRAGHTGARLLHAAASRPQHDEHLANELHRHASHLRERGDLPGAEHHLEAAFALLDDPEKREILARELTILGAIAGRPGSAARWVAVGNRQRDGTTTAPSTDGAIRRAMFTRDQRDSLRAAIAARCDASLTEVAPLLVQCLVIGVVGCMPDLLHDVEVAEQRCEDALATSLQSANERDGVLIALSVAFARFLATCDREAGAKVCAATPRLLELIDEAGPVPDVESAGSSPTRAGLYWGIAAMADERWGDADRLLTRAAEVERANGWIGPHASTSGWLAELRWRQGRWAEADEISRDTLASPLVDSEAAVMARSIVVRSDALRSTQVLRPARDLEGVETTGIWTAVLHHGLGLAAIGALDYDEATTHLRRVEALLGDSLRHPGLLWWQGDLVEATAAAGSKSDAVAALERFELNTTHVEGPAIALGLGRARAAVQSGRPACRILQRSLGADDLERIPFECARTRLALAYECRVDDLAASQELAELALASFESVGAAGFVRQAGQLARSAITDPAVASRALTERGREIADLAASGATNRSIAQSTGLSDKTVEFHLAKCFRILSISRRSELSGFFSSTPTPGP